MMRTDKRKPEAKAPGDAIFYTSQLKAHRGMLFIDTSHRKAVVKNYEGAIRLMRHCGIDLGSWLHGFSDTEDAVKETVDIVANHPLMPRDVRVAGYIMDSETGELTTLS